MFRNDVILTMYANYPGLVHRRQNIFFNCRKESESKDNNKKEILPLWFNRTIFVPSPRNSTRTSWFYATNKTFNTVFQILTLFST